VQVFCGIHCTKFEPFLKAIPTRKSETMRTKFCGNNFLGKGFRKTSADSFFLNSDVASGGGGVWGGILRLLLFLFWRNSGGLSILILDKFQQVKHQGHLKNQLDWNLVKLPFSEFVYANASQIFFLTNYLNFSLTP